MPNGADFTFRLAGQLCRASSEGQGQAFILLERACDSEVLDASVRGVTPFFRCLAFHPSTSPIHIPHGVTAFFRDPAGESTCGSQRHA